MEQVFKSMVWSYLHENYPEYLWELSCAGELGKFLSDGVEDIGEVESDRDGYLLVEEWVKQKCSFLGESKFRYIREVLQQEFQRDYYKIAKSGLLAFHLMRILESCKQLFELFPQGDRSGLQELVIEHIQAYLGAKHGWQHL